MIESDPFAGLRVESDGVHVAVAVIRDGQGRVLIARRAPHAHQGGRWEFPGGKVEPDEDIHAALRRELREELGIVPRRMFPLLRIAHRYPEKKVLLDVWDILAFDGEPTGREGQPLRWVAPAALEEYRFPDANNPIVRAVRLPHQYLISPQPVPGAERDFLRQLQHRLLAGIRLVQLRAHDLDDDEYTRLAEQCRELCQRHGALLQLNRDPGLAAQLGTGLHLTSRRLNSVSTRPALASGQLLSASCHDALELDRAEALQVDFCVLGPVERTASHPGAEPLGFPAFAELIRNRPVPVFALGGMRATHLDIARYHRAQGIAAISALWSP